MKLVFKILQLPLDSARFNKKERVNIPLYFTGPEIDISPPNTDRLWFCWNEDWKHQSERKKWNILYQLKKL